MIRILIADDHTLMRDGLKQILATAGDMVLVAGNYCPGPSHQCAEVHEEYEREQKRIEKL